MKKIFPFVLLLICFYGCKPYDEDYVQPVKPIYNEITLNNVNVLNSEVMVDVTDSTQSYLNFYFYLIAPNRLDDSVTCSLSGLPAGIIDSSGAASFKLPQSWNVHLNVNTDTGIYTVNLSISGAYGQQTYPVLIHVLPVPDGAPGLVGTYSGSDPCGHFSIGDVWYTYTAKVVTFPGRPHWIGIQNYRGLGDSIVVQALVYGVGIGGINIPLQTVGGYTIFGNGTGYFGVSDSSNKPWISVFGDTIIHAGDTQTCYMQLHQQ